MPEIDTYTGLFKFIKFALEYPLLLFLLLLLNTKYCKHSVSQIYCNNAFLDVENTLTTKS